MGMYTYEAINKMNALARQSKRFGNTLFGILLGGVLIIMLVTAGFCISGDGTFGDKEAKFLLYLFLLLFLVIFVCCILFIPKAERNTKEINKIYKETFLTGVFQEFFEEAYYRWDKGFDKETVLDADLFGRAFNDSSEFYSEDYLSGKYNGVSFQHADVSWISTNGKYGNDRTVHFAGRMFIFDYSFKEVSSVKVIPKLNKDLSVTTKIYTDDIRMDLVKLESVEFNKIFLIGAKNPEEAFYVLTPQMMECILTLWKNYGGFRQMEVNQSSIPTLRGIFFHFKRDKLYVIMEGMNAFGSYPKQMDYPTEKARIRKDIQVIIDVIEMLNLIKKTEEEK